MKTEIIELVTRAVGAMNGGDITVDVDRPENALHGDYTTNVAMRIATSDKRQATSAKWKNPMELAAAIKNAIIQHQKTSKLEWLDRVEVVPPGFINLFLSEASLVSTLSGVLKEKDRYGSVPLANSLPTKDTIDTVGKGMVKSGRISGKKNLLRSGISLRETAQISRKNNANTTSGRPNGKRTRPEQGRRVMVEFADPNPFKEFHIGHLRNISLGESYCRLMEATGDTVRRVNYQGDVGMHVAKSLYGLLHNPQFKVQSSKLKTPKEKAEFLGKAYAFGAKAFEESEKAKKEISELNKKVYAQDPTIMALYEQGRKWSLDYFDNIYARLGTSFDRFYFESEVASLGMKTVLDYLADGVFERSEGAIVYRGEKVGLHTRVFVSKEKYATYEAKDLALAPLKYSEWPYDVSIIMTGNEQSEYFKVMLAALHDINPDLARKTRHMPFGMVNLKKGKMSSRTGNVITADLLIEEARKAIYNILQKSKSKYTKEDQENITERAAIAAIKYSMLKVDAKSEIAFDIKESVNFDGDSGPYLQYTYARAKSVLRKGETLVIGDQLSVYSKTDNRKLITENSSLNPEERALARRISYFPEIVVDAATNYSPNTVCTYLFQLAQEFNLFYAKHQILGEPSAISHQPSANQKAESRKLTAESSLRLALTAATAQVIKNGLYLLGIEVLEEM